MAYQTRGRDPLLDSDTQAFIEKRGRELIGVLLLILGGFVSVMIATYSSQDPGWMVASTTDVQNWTGRIGASIAAPVLRIVGFGSWGIAVSLLVWGARFITHTGSERALARMTYAPVFWVFCALYAATMTPSPDWGHSFSMGGLLGDTVLFMVLNLVPGSAALGVNIAMLVLGVVVVILAGYTLGTTITEIRQTAGWINYRGAQGIVWVLRKTGRLAQNTAQSGVQKMQDWRDDRREQAARHDPELTQHVADVVRANPAMPTGKGKVEETTEKAPQSLFGRLPGFSRQKTAPAPVAVEPDRISSKIAQAIHARSSVLEDTDNIFLEDDEVVETTTPFTIDPLPMRSGDNRVVTPRAAKPATSRRAVAEAQPTLQFETPAERAYEAPPFSLLMNPDLVERHVLSDAALKENARMLETVLDDYGVKGEIVAIRPGPVVTMYELEPAPGLKASRVIGLADDIARSMSALSARVSTVPGRSVIGIELPNANREKVVLRELLSTRDFDDNSMRLPLALGKDIGGDPIVANLAKMPHLLIAGTTGSGKSVAINTMILSLLYKLSPEECRMIMIDPKMLELSVYDGIPHLLSPVVTDPKKAVVALKWVVGEMEDRYRKMSKMGVRNIDGYNSRVRETLAKGENFSRTVQTGFDDMTGEPVFETEEFAPETLPYIVVVVDEMADLMMVAGKEIEACIQRLAQMARASGIHLIMATQRPSVDVITGTIKANFPTRISFQVTSKVDSRTILGEQGAEQLLGMGDMLYMAGGGKITRVHGPFCSDEEVEEIVNYLKTFGPPEYVGGVVEGPDGERESDIDQVLGLGGNTDAEDALYDTAVQVVVKDRKCSTSYIQRKLAIGYNKAARLVEQMEENGLVSPANHVGKREILVPEPGA